jgi:excisionase family DNA binding protein
MPDPFVTIADAAYTLAVDPVTIRRWIASGRLPAVRVGGTAVRIPKAAVEALTGPGYNPEDWVSISDAAALYSVSEWSIRRWIQQRDVETRRLGTRATRVSVKSLEKLTEPVALAVG